MSSFQISNNFHDIKAGISTELFENIIPFWYNNSFDEEYGGWFSCLDRNGELFDERKFLWLNGRQLWMYARLCNDVSAEDLKLRSKGKLQKEKLLYQAEKSADFLLEHSFNKEGMAYFSLDRQGKAYNFQRKMFSSCFLCIGLGSLSQHSILKKASLYRSEARKLLQSIVSLSHDPSPLGRDIIYCDGAPQSSPMNVPMILLNVIDEMRRAGAIESVDDNDGDLFAEEEKWCIGEILKHVILDKKLVLENVSPDGSIIPGYDGRHMNPGHAIEAGWFVLSYAERNKREDLTKLALNMIEWSFEAGWDNEYGGLYYFLDSEGKSPPYLEWNMKLWWPHTEALIAYAMLYEKFRDKKYWERFVKIYQYTLAHFSDMNGGGEWYGYLDRAGNPTHRFKGGPYKGCFHVPRSLLFVDSILRRISDFDSS